MVTSYVSLRHLTHTGPFHTSLNHSSGQLLTINTLPVYCHTSVLAILSCSAWPVKMKAMCFFEMSGTNAPVTQHHNPEDSNCDCCGERFRSCEHQIDSNSDVCLSMIMLTFSILLCTFGRVANIFEFFHCVLLVEVKVSTLKVHFASLSAHCGNAENIFQHLWTRIFQRIIRQPNLKPY